MKPPLKAFKSAYAALCSKPDSVFYASAAFISAVAPYMAHEPIGSAALMTTATGAREIVRYLNLEIRACQLGSREVHAQVPLTAKDSIATEAVATFSVIGCAAELYHSIVPHALPLAAGASLLTYIRLRCRSLTLRDVGERYFSEDGMFNKRPIRSYQNTEKPAATLNPR